MSLSTLATVARLRIAAATTKRTPLRSRSGPVGRLIAATVLLLLTSLLSVAHAQITVFTECNFQGRAIPLTPGIYDSAALERAGVADNSISSIVVSDGFSTSLYVDDRIDGRSGTLYATSSCLDKDKFDNEISSLIVQKRGDEGKMAQAARLKYPRRDNTVAVKFYSFCDYRGVEVELGAGDYRLSDLKEAGINNNDITSIKVPRGFKVIAYENDFFRGRSIALDDNDNCLRDDGIDEQISSVSITVDESLIANNSSLANSSSSVNQAAPDNVIAYSECNYQGLSVELKPGEYTVSDLQKLGMPNNAISSFRLPPGFSAAIYENDFFRGNGRLLEADSRCLVGDPLNDRISSIVVEASSTATQSGSSSSTLASAGSSAAAATVYTKCGFEGGRAGLAVGEYDAATLNLLGIKENSISSVKVNPGFQIELFFFDFLRGKSGYLRDDDNCLSNDGFDNEVSSLKITKVSETNRPLTPVDSSEETAAATVFGECDYTGGSVSLKPGRYTQDNLRELGIGNDLIASLKVQPGHTVVLYDNGQLRGRGVAFTADDDCVKDDGLYRRVSALIIAPTRNRNANATANNSGSSQRNALVALDNGLKCVSLYVDRNVCTANRWNDIRKRCELDQVPSMSDGYLEQHVRAGNCTTRYWSDLQERIKKPSLR